MAYTITLKNRSGGTVVASVPASSARFNMNLNAPGAADIVVPLRHADVTASNFAVGQREVYIASGTTTVWGGELMAVRADAKAQTLSLNAVGFYERFRRRLIEDTKTYEIRSPAYIVEDLITYVQSLTNGNMGITVSWSGGEGATLTQAYCCWDGTFLADIIETLAARGVGFDFEVGHDKVFRGYNTRKTVSSSASFTLGTGPTSTTNILDLNVEEDASEIANYIMGLPPDDDCLSCEDVVRASGSGMSTYGRLGDFLDLSDFKSKTNRQAFADAEVDFRSEPAKQVELTTTSMPWGSESYETGSVVSITASLGWISYSSTQMRVVGWEAEVESGYETCRLTLDSRTS